MLGFETSYRFEKGALTGQPSPGPQQNECFLAVISGLTPSNWCEISVVTQHNEWQLISHGQNNITVCANENGAIGSLVSLGWFLLTYHPSPFPHASVSSQNLLLKSYRHFTSYFPLFSPSLSSLSLSLSFSSSFPPSSSSSSLLSSRPGRHPPVPPSLATRSTPPNGRIGHHLR